MRGGRDEDMSVGAAAEIPGLVCYVEGVNIEVLALRAQRRRSCRWSCIVDSQHLYSIRML